MKRLKFINHSYNSQGIRDTVVSRWTTGQKVERQILRQGHDSQQNSSHSPRLSPAQLSLTVQNRSLKHHSFRTIHTLHDDIICSSNLMYITYCVTKIPVFFSTQRDALSITKQFSVTFSQFNHMCQRLCQKTTPIRMHVIYDIS